MERGGDFFFLRIRLVCPSSFQLASFFRRYAHRWPGWAVLLSFGVGTIYPVLPRTVDSFRTLLLAHSHRTHPLESI